MFRTQLKRNLRLHTLFEASHKLNLPMPQLLKAIRLGHIQTVELDFEGYVLRIVQWEID